MGFLQLKILFCIYVPFCIGIICLFHSKHSSLTKQLHQAHASWQWKTHLTFGSGVWPDIFKCQSEPHDEISCTPSCMYISDQRTSNSKHWHLNCSITYKCIRYYILALCLLYSYFSCFEYLSDQVRMNLLPFFSQPGSLFHMGPYTTSFTKKSYNEKFASNLLSECSWQ